MAKTGLDKKKMGMKAKENIYQSILWVILLLLAATMVLPFLYVVVVSFTDATVYSAGSFYLWPRKWSVEAYKLILSGAGFCRRRHIHHRTEISIPVSHEGEQRHSRQHGLRQGQHDDRKGPHLSTSIHFSRLFQFVGKGLEEGTHHHDIPGSAGSWQNHGKIIVYQPQVPDIHKSRHHACPKQHGKRHIFVEEPFAGNGLGKHICHTGIHDDTHRRAYGRDKYGCLQGIQKS